MKKLVILPGGFHPYHAGHYALYQSAKKAFPDADVYVAATDDQSERPFPFALKEKLAKLAGVEPGHFVRVKSPFQAREITSNYNPDEDVLIFVRSEKDRNEQPKPGGTKKDGSPSYFQPWTGKNLQPFSKQAYIAYLPTVEFGPGITSATQIRKAWPTLNDKRKLALVMSLYPAAQKNLKLAQNVVQMFDQVMGEKESVEKALSESLLTKFQELGMVGRVEYMGSGYKMPYRATLQDKKTGQIWHKDFDGGKEAEDWLVNTLSKYEQWKLSKIKENTKESVAEGSTNDTIGVLINTVERLFHKNQIHDYDSLEAIRQGLKHYFSKPGATTETAIDGILNILDKRMRKSGNYVDLGRFKEALRQGIAHKMKKVDMEENIKKNHKPILGENTSIIDYLDEE